MRTRSTLSTPGFVADPASLRYDTGRQIDWDNVPAGTDTLPPGTLVTMPDDGTKSVPAVDGTGAGFLQTHAHRPGTAGGLADALTGYGVLIGGHLYENLLPDAVAGELPAAAKAALGPLFTFQTYRDSRLA